MTEWMKVIQELLDTRGTETLVNAYLASVKSGSNVEAARPVKQAKLRPFATVSLSGRHATLN